MAMRLHAPRLPEISLLTWAKKPRKINRGYFNQDVAPAWLCYLVIAALSAALWLGLVAIYLAARPLT